MNKGQPPKIERRSGKRFQTPIQLHLQDEGEATTVSTRDIGMNGLSCYLPRPLGLFTKYRFRLFVPDGEEGPREIDGEGIVVRVEEVEVRGEILFSTALFFQHLDDGHYQILDAYLKRIDGIAP